MLPAVWSEGKEPGLPENGGRCLALSIVRHRRQSLVRRAARNCRHEHRISDGPTVIPSTGISWIRIVGVHPIFFGLRRRGKLKPDRRSPASGCRLANLRWLGFVDWRPFAPQPRAQWNGMPRLLGQDKNSWRAWTEWAGRAMTGSGLGKPKAVSFRAGSLQRNGWPARAEPHRVRECEATIRAEWFGNAASGPIRA